MKRRMDIYDVAHEWANRTDVNVSATSSNLFFAGGAIYSYGEHFMIAKHVSNQQGDKAILFTEKKYSKTTSKHVSIVASASSHLTKIFVPDPTLSKEELFEVWREQIIQIAHHLGTARKPEKYLLEMQQAFGQAKRYADFFGFQIPEALTKVAMVENLAQFSDYLKIEREQQEAKEKKERSKRLKAQNKLLKDWRSFKRDYLRTYDGLDYLRFNAKTGQVETTQGVRFPLPAGRQLYQFVVETNTKGGCTSCGQLFLERYSINEVNKHFIRIGCHKVTIKEIKLFATQQGWC
ncbi:hypothetical protein FO440_18265 [Mucilaginibacter corticis]|uniref:Uncharacterized protein n=1 Tax=Mucilaginibacter corticis TaxID=2597670 RepID=A0A556MIE3_9SPHI|nr:hypothetical protein [Mucilaginibacter corticis]TSJ39684.1 hypothetical protein FO440_18265 [Mucilaginibacter corticis]